VEDDDDDVFEGLDEFVTDLSSLRLSSGLRVDAPMGADGQQLVGTTSLLLLLLLLLLCLLT
jgi:hypothetical protein